MGNSNSRVHNENNNVFYNDDLYEPYCCGYYTKKDITSNLQYGDKVQFEYFDQGLYNENHLFINNNFELLKDFKDILYNIKKKFIKR